jgi:MFS family permease
MILQGMSLLFLLSEPGNLGITLAMIGQGMGTALVYPSLLALISDASRPEWRSSSLGVYRLWRDGGYVVGAVMAGLLADRLGLGVSIGIIGGLTVISGLVALVNLTSQQEGE